MKKTNLKDIMESLVNDDTETATAALHEWFVDQGKRVQAQISGEPVEEQTIVENTEDDVFDIADYVCDQIAQTGAKEGSEEFDYGDDIADFIWKQVPYTLDDYSSYQPHLRALDPLAEGRPIVDSGYYPDDEKGIGIVYIVVNDNGEVEESAVHEADADPAKAFRASLNKAVAVMKKAGVLTPQDEQLIAQARANSSTDALAGLSPKAAAMAAKLIKAPAAAPAASGINWEGIQLTGDPKTDAKGWVAIAQHIIKFAQEGQAHAADDLDEDDYSFIVSCAQDAIPLFQQGDIDGGLSAMLPDANAQDLISGEVGPDNYNDYFFYHKTGATVESVVESEEEETEEKVDESYDDLVAELNEAFQGLETVSDKLQNQEGAQVGEQGKVPVNTKATLPSYKGDKRVGGEPVEIKSNGHKGHDLEKAPKVQDVKVKGNVQNSKDDPKKVADKGDKSALLNKVDGSINTQSPISGKGAKGLKK